jgi:flagellar M-ring protein FliF
MDNAITTSSNLPTHTTAATWRERMGQMPLRSLFALGVGLAALLAIAITLTVLSTRGDYKVLFAGLSDKDGGAVVAQLTQMNVPYRMGEGGSAILVPSLGSPRSGSKPWPISRALA